MWLSLVERCVRDAEAAGSNPVISTKKPGMPFGVLGFLFAIKVRTCAGSSKQLQNRGRFLQTAKSGALMFWRNRSERSTKPRAHRILSYRPKKT